MNQVIRDALKAKYTGELAEANANIKIDMAIAHVKLLFIMSLLCKYVLYFV